MNVLNGVIKIGIVAVAFVFVFSALSVQAGQHFYLGAGEGAYCELAGYNATGEKIAQAMEDDQRAIQNMRVVIVTPATSDFNLGAREGTYSELAGYSADSAKIAQAMENDQRAIQNLQAGVFTASSGLTLETPLGYTSTGVANCHFSEWAGGYVCR